MAFGFTASNLRDYVEEKTGGAVRAGAVKSIGLDVLRHRVAVTYEAEAEDITSEKIIEKVFANLPVP